MKTTKRFLANKLSVALLALATALVASTIIQVTAFTQSGVQSEITPAMEKVSARLGSDGKFASPEEAPQPAPPSGGKQSPAIPNSVTTAANYVFTTGTN